METFLNVGDYLCQQLYSRGVRHVFGVPGDYVLGVFGQMERNGLHLVNTCDEQGAGFAADAYARLAGLGVVCVTYGVGGLKLANTTAQAFAEESPVVIISGAPGMMEREHDPLLHHRVRTFDTQRIVFDELTVASSVLTEPETAVREIDRVLDAAVRHSRPVYLELPRDVAVAPAVPCWPSPNGHSKRDSEALREALAEAAAAIDAAVQPVILTDIEAQRFGLQAEIQRLAQDAGIPTATTILGKSTVEEQDPGYLGVYQGAVGRAEVRRYVESSDCVVLLGVLMTDFNLGMFTARLDPSRCITATHDKLSVGRHSYEHVDFRDFVRGLSRAGLRRRDMPSVPRRGPAIGPPSAGESDQISADGLFRRLDSSLTEDTILICDVGDALFGATDVTTRRPAGFLAPAYYASLGFAVPASIGAQLAQPALRPLVLVGDGGFQMTGMELATTVRLGLNPIVVVLNNQGYVTLRCVRDGPYNDLLPWDYARVPELLGAGRAFAVCTEEELDRALLAAARHTESFCLLDVRLGRNDTSGTLQRLGRQLAQRLARSQSGAAAAEPGREDSSQRRWSVRRWLQLTPKRSASDRCPHGVGAGVLPGQP